MNRKEACKAISFILIFVLLLTGVSYIVRTNGDVKDRFAGFYAEEKDSISHRGKALRLFREELKKYL